MRRAYNERCNLSTGNAEAKVVQDFDIWTSRVAERDAAEFYLAVLVSWFITAGIEGVNL